MNGMIKKSQPTQGDVHVDAILTNVSVAFTQDESSFVARNVFPVVPSGNQSDLYYEYPKDFFFRNELEKRAPGAETKGIGYEVTTSNFFCDVYGLHHDVPDQVRANADSPINPDRDATVLLTHQGLIGEEVLWASTYFTTGVWTGDFTGVSGAPGANQFQRFDEAGSTPIEVIRAGMTRVQARTGRRPNKLTLGREVWDILTDHADIVGRLDRGQTTGPAMANRDDLARILELDEILVMDAIQATSAEGATPAFSFIGGKAMLLTHSPRTANVLTPSAGYTFAWTGLFGAAAGGQGMRINRLRADLKASDRIEMEKAFDHKVVSADLGSFFATAVN